MECEPCLGRRSCWLGVQSIMQSHFPWDKHWNDGEKNRESEKKKKKKDDKNGEFWQYPGEG